nr:cyclic nucleotide-binding domain-containing protein [Kofleriaceae bacterium]
MTATTPPRNGGLPRAARDVAWVLACANAAAAVLGPVSDALFIEHVGARWIGVAVAGSSALLAIVLAVIGALSDSWSRRGLLVAIGGGALTLCAVMLALIGLVPSVAAVVGFVGGKQIIAAIDLVLWVILAHELDARAAARYLPTLAALGGAGSVAGALLAIPLARCGPIVVIAAAAALFVVAIAMARRLVDRARIRRASVRPGLRLLVDAWRAGAAATGRTPLARGLALVAALAGGFAAAAYFVLGSAMAQSNASLAELTSVLAAVRMVTQVLIVFAQWRLTAWLLRKLGVGRGLIASPLLSVVVTGGLLAVSMAPGLTMIGVPAVVVMAIAMQVLARLTDAVVQTPTDRLVQALLPTALRGRIAGFIEGSAKRMGAIAAGLMLSLLHGSRGAALISCGIGIAWLAVAWWFAQRVPRLAISAAAQRTAGPGATDAALDDAVDARTIALLHTQLTTTRSDDAVELLARLHLRGRIDAAEALTETLVRRQAQASRMLRARVVDVLADGRARPNCAARLTRCTAESDVDFRRLVTRAIGLCGPSDLVPAWFAAQGDDACDVQRVARWRISGRPVPELCKAIAELPTRIAVEEMRIEVLRQIRNPTFAPTATLVAAGLVRLLARESEQAIGHQGAFAALTEWANRSAPRDGEFVLIAQRTRDVARGVVDSDLPALVHTRPAALTLVAALWRASHRASDEVEAVSDEDLRRMADALGDRHDDMRSAAYDALQSIGAPAAYELLATMTYRRRAARDLAAQLLAAVAVPKSLLRRGIDVECDELERTTLALGAVCAPAGQPVTWLERRLDERIDEIAHTIVLLAAASRQDAALAVAADAWQWAPSRRERARYLAVLDAALPRAIVERIGDAVDEQPAAARAAAVAQRCGRPIPSQAQALHEELIGPDAIARSFAMDFLDVQARMRQRNAIASVATAQMQAANAVEILRRVHDVTQDSQVEMPSRVETLIVLGKVPLLGALSSRQLSDLAERARWQSAPPGAVIIAGGEVVDALWVVASGELRIGDRFVGEGESVDELAWVAPLALDHDVQVVKSAQLLRIDRLDFNELVDDVPGLGVMFCRALGERVRMAAGAGY